MVRPRQSWGMDDSGYTYEVDMVDLKSKEHKRARHVIVD